MRILVTGSRDWDDLWILETAIQQEWWKRGGTAFNVAIIHGDCPTGADKMADAVALKARFRVERHPALWAKHGRAAGPIRNREMVEAGADVCLAFIKNKSRGATGCADMAEKAGIPTRRFVAASLEGQTK
jgi:hypothetical protein